jgi:UDPglucose 6-dehydrogenase
LNVSIIGAGYVGLNTGVALAYLGHQVTCVEQSREKLDLLLQYQAPFLENGLSELLVDHNVQSHLRFTAEGRSAFPQSDVIMIAVGTPSRQNGKADISQVERAAGEIAVCIRPDQELTVVVKSTVPVGTSLRVQHLVKEALSRNNISADIGFASNPEFLREGQALFDTLYPERVIIGSHSKLAIEMLTRLYEPILQQTFAPPSFIQQASPKRPQLLIVNPRSAELTKYAANAFLATKISYINEIAGLSERLGADVEEIAQGVGLDSRIGNSFLKAGAGWGGSCFPKDTDALVTMAEECGYSMPIVQATIAVNKRQRTAIVEKLQTGLKGVRGRKIGILGLAFKPGTDDLREAPALDIIEQLLERDAYLKVHDPVALHNFQATHFAANVTIADTPFLCAQDCDALVLMTEWEQYCRLDWQLVRQQMIGDLIVDARNALDRKVLEQAGLRVIGIGR